MKVNLGARNLISSLLSRTIIPVGLCIVGLSISAHAYMRFDTGSRHDFISRCNVTSSGVCDQCHAAGGGAADDRLFRWPVAGTGAVQDTGMCMLNCHNTTTATWPSGTFYTSAQAMCGSPPKPPHSCVSYRCAECHNLQGTDYRDCLKCHTTGKSDTMVCATPTGKDVGKDTEVDKFFAGIGTDVPVTTIRGQHNLIYNTAGDLSNPTDNECLKCHGVIAVTAHPGGSIDGTALLVYPDDPDGSGPLITGSGIVMNTRIERDYGKFQNFCLSCHDGQADGGAPPANITLGGQSVPKLPRFNTNSGPPNDSLPPYLASFAAPPTEELYPTVNYFEMNGHGRDTGMEGTAMNLTCLGQDPALPGPQVGCHSAHGSTNYFIIEDSRLGVDVDTPRELGQNVCMAAGCHSNAKLATYTNNRFHSWLSESNQLLHGGTGPVYDTFAWWEPLPTGNNMNVANPGVIATDQIMPHFTGPDADLVAGRVYSGRVFGTASGAHDGSIITCITCHEPHGTSNMYLDYMNDGIGSKAMVRWLIQDFSYDDPLCEKCHVDPN